MSDLFIFIIKSGQNPLSVCIVHKIQHSYNNKLLSNYNCNKNYLQGYCISQFSVLQYERTKCL